MQLRAILKRALQRCDAIADVETKAIILMQPVRAIWRLPRLNCSVENQQARMVFGSGQLSAEEESWNE
jgi:hypothetical protein